MEVPSPDGLPHDADLLQLLQDGQHGRQCAAPLHAPRDGDAAADCRNGPGQLAAGAFRLQMRVLHLPDNRRLQGFGPCRTMQKASQVQCVPMMMLLRKCQSSEG